MEESNKFNIHKDWLDAFLKDGIDNPENLKEYETKTTLELEGQYSDVLFDDGVPVLKIFERNQGKWIMDFKVPAATKCIQEKGRTYWWYYFQYKEGWVQVKGAQIGYENGPQMFKEILEEARK